MNSELLELFGYSITSWQLFAGIGMILLAFEAATMTFYLLPIGLAFLLTAFFSYFLILSFTSQIILLSLFIVIHFFAFKKWIQPKLKKNETLTGVDSMIGKEAWVTEVIQNDQSKGYIQLYGDSWRALSVHSETIEVGASVVIERIEGNKVWVVRKARS